MAEGEFAALDEQRFKAFHWRATLTTGLGVFCDGYDPVLDVGRGPAADPAILRPPGP